MSSFSFRFSGDDIDTASGGTQAASTTTPADQASAFPIPGQAQHIPPQHHDLTSMLASLPSKIAYSTLEVCLDDGQTLHLPRRELWDVRVQIMAEAARDEDEAEGVEKGEDFVLGTRDVKTGVYEGGFKSWESSGDLVKVLAGGCHPRSWGSRSARIIELGCGTALPSLALFQWTMAMASEHQNQRGTHPQRAISFILADYNPTVLQLVTLPNFILTWALHQQQHAPIPALQEAFSQQEPGEGELELTPEVLESFRVYLLEHAIHLFFLSGGWSPEFVHLLYSLPSHPPQAETAACISLLLGAETIYSPFALQAFVDMVVAVLEREAGDTSAWVAAKKLYFGVGGSLDDFVTQVMSRGVLVESVREETEGVRRGVVRCCRPT
ncbi:hypothetical protein E4U36_004358 [Claviceps purpurea]|nr:hypothetical protein E4U28_004165 [Claviceps purpurea]KAG6181050.1 hypothetical protein E4U36_004358 [Claviceps purpurea]